MTNDVEHLSMYLFAYLSVYLLWWNIHSNHLVIWKAVFSYCWIVSILYIQVLYWNMICKYFLHFLVISVWLSLHILPESISYSSHWYYHHSGSSLLGHLPTLASIVVFLLPHLHKDLDWPTVQSANSSQWTFKNAHCIISPPCITSFKGSLFPWHQTQVPDNGPQMPHPHYLIPAHLTGAIFCHSPSCTPCCSHNDLSPQTHRASRPKAFALA